MKRKPGVLFWIGVGYLVLLVFMAFFGPSFTHDPLSPLGKAYQPPTSEFWLGTDQQGRDLFARLARGAQVSLLIGISVQAIALVVGVTVGVIGVYAPRWISLPLMRFTDGMFAFPDLLLAILIVGLFGMGFKPVIASLAIAAWPAVARLVQTQVATLRDREYVVAARAMGASTVNQVLRHILPHLAGILLAVVMVDIASTILAESTLSFLGIGIQAPNPSWGGMIQDGNSYKNTQPLLLVWPCVVLSLTIFALNFVGDGLRSLADPKGEIR